MDLVARIRRSPLTADTLLAVGLTLFSWLQLAAVPLFFFSARVPGGGPGPGGPGGPSPFIFRAHTPTLLTFALVAACFLPLALRRRYPLTVLGVVAVASALYDLYPQPPALTILGVMIALYTVGTLVDRRRLVIAAVATGAIVLIGSIPTVDASRWLIDIIRTLAVVAVAAAVGVAVRNQRAYVAEMEERAAEAERTRDEEARRQVDEERLRIARELHDITAHSLSIIAVQSAAATRVLDKDPAEARESLENIRRTSKEALTELRGVVGVLRGADDPVPPTVPLAPTPSLARIAELVRPVEDAGFQVDVELGELGDLPGLVDSSAYRIVQEALTNVVRHAGPAKVMVKVTRPNGWLDIEVTDTGRGSGDGLASGHGIPGMRERAAALGGEFEAGPQAGGGFRVHARLPVTPKGA